MLIVPCPNCGPRNSADMRYGGESHSRPDPDSTPIEEWRNYLYMHDNPAGWLKETWYCGSGCRRYFTTERNTVTNQFREPAINYPEPGGSQ